MMVSRRAFVVGFTILIQLLHPVIAIGPKKYQLWFPDWGYYLLPLSFKDNNGRCAKLVNNYWRDGPTGSLDKPWSCSLVLDCILQDTPEHGSQMLSASLVLLGLTPTVLSSLGMSVAEATMLSFELPLLSTLLSFGSVVVYPSRILVYDDPVGTVLPSPNTSTLLSLLPLIRQPKTRKLIRVIEYVAALGAVANVFYMSLELGWRTILSWDCDSSYLPLLWVLLPGVIHLISIFSFLLRPKAVSGGAHDASSQRTATTKVLPRDGTQGQKSQGLRSGAETICTLHPTRWTLLIDSIVSGVAVGHIMFGTLIFSSLMFMTVKDTVPVIFRFGMSAVICRIISWNELAWMSEKYRVECVDSLEGKGRRIYVAEGWWRWRHDMQLKPGKKRSERDRNVDSSASA
ncbi:hypothetical protein Moror_6241 [Moniliophthora roreri MCA 2997]|uniref:Uncharacterized protein n=1 Tax=Moniliophthora roreri (strain MCA 2997) TaxID=1381753 RepID=V2WC53_MONRO|nr:hypothetical protein Moror_6241 [Moniliophthora roreri MCA 2997]